MAHGWPTRAVSGYRFNATSPGALVLRLYRAGNRLDWRDLESRDVLIPAGYDAWARYANTRYIAAQRGDYHSHRDLLTAVALAERTVDRSDALTKETQ